MFRLESSRLRALRQLAGLGKKAASVCESSSVLQSAWGAALGVSAPAANARRGALAAPRALYHKRNPYDFRVVRDEDDELPGVQNLELSIDEMDEQRKKAERGVDEAKAAALKLLGSRAHSRKELKLKLLERGHELHDVRAALDRLQSVGLQSDSEFAETYVRSKWRQSKWGPRRIELELHRRGVDVEAAAEALRSVFGEGLDVRQHLEQLGDEEGGGGGGGLAGAPEQQLLEGARRQWARMDRLPEEARRRRFVAWMQRRGHRWDDIRGLLRQLEREDARLALDGED